jgi:hypothetical protein
MVGSVVSNELQKIMKEDFVAQSGSYFVICLEELRKIKISVGQYSKCLGRE